MDIAAEVIEGDNTLQIHLEYNTDLFDLSTIQRLARGFGMLVEGATASPNFEISRHDFIDPSEAKMLVEKWSISEEVDGGCPKTSSVYSFFEQHALNNADHVALVFDDGNRTMSYGELNSRANQLATQIEALIGENRMGREKSGDNVFIGLCAQESCWVMAA